MLTLICAKLRNYFCSEQDIVIGDFSIIDGVLVPSVSIAENQYFRIVGSVFNDGVHEYDDNLVDEDEFHGAIWKMRVPKDVIKLAEDIEEWQNKYGSVDSTNMSPYSSESFGGYSYSKSQGYANSGGKMMNNWESVFADRLAPYMRIRPI